MVQIIDFLIDLVEYERHIISHNFKSNLNLSARFGKLDPGSIDKVYIHGPFVIRHMAHAAHFPRRKK